MTLIKPSLWFDDDLEGAIDFYTRLFPESSVGDLQRYGPDGPGPEGALMAAGFTLGGVEFIGINGGPAFAFTEAVSFTVGCADQAEIDHYWEALTADGGEESMCGWLKDRFGLSWQIVPADIGALLARPGAVRAMLGMRRLVIADLEAAGAEQAAAPLG